jgi:hypothetical protein
MDRVTKQLHAAQDRVKVLEPAAEPVLDLRRRQAAWDAEHAAADALSLLPKLAAQRRLGARARRGPRGARSSGARRYSVYLL